MPNCKADNVLETPQSQPAADWSESQAGLVPASPLSSLSHCGSSQDVPGPGAQCQVFLPDTSELMPCKTTESLREVPAETLAAPALPSSCLSLTRGTRAPCSGPAGWQTLAAHGHRGFCITPRVSEVARLSSLPLRPGPPLLHFGCLTNRGT